MITEYNINYCKATAIPNCYFGINILLAYLIYILLAFLFLYLGIRLERAYNKHKDN